MKKFENRLLRLELAKKLDIIIDVRTASDEQLERICCDAVSELQYKVLLTEQDQLTLNLCRQALETKTRSLNEHT